MIMSMTGFASRTFTVKLGPKTTVSITLSIKSLNSRFFETTFKLPYVLSHLETELLQLCKTKLKRGHVFFTINVSNQNAFKSDIQPALNVVRSYLHAIEQLKKATKVPGTITITDLVQLPNTFNVEEKELDTKTKKAILTATSGVLTTLVDMRNSEGQALLKDLEQRMALLHKEIAEIEKIADALLQARKEAIGKELHERTSDEEALSETQRLMLYGELDKMDIHEEIVRFKSHLQSLTATLRSPDNEKGKRLDFTLQELGREINTVAAKSSDATIGALVINCKVELEKMREQVQNLV